MARIGRTGFGAFCNEKHGTTLERWSLRLGHGFEEGSCSDVPRVVAIDYGAKDNIFEI